MREAVDCVRKGRRGESWSLGAFRKEREVSELPTSLPALNRVGLRWSGQAQKNSRTERRLADVIYGKKKWLWKMTNQAIISSTLFCPLSTLPARQSEMRGE